MKAEENKDFYVNSMIFANIAIFFILLFTAVMLSKKDEYLNNLQSKLNNIEYFQEMGKDYIRNFYSAVKEKRVFVGPLILDKGGMAVSNCVFIIPYGSYGTIFNSSNCSVSYCSFISINETNK